MTIRIKVFVREEGFDCIPELIVGCHTLRGNRFKMLLFSFLSQIFTMAFSSFQLYNFSLEGHLEYLFVILDLSIIGFAQMVGHKRSAISIIVRRKSYVAFFYGLCFHISPVALEGYVYQKRLSKLMEILQKTLCIDKMIS